MAHNNMCSVLVVVVVELTDRKHRSDLVFAVFRARGGSHVHVLVHICSHTEWVWCTNCI